MRVRKQKMGAMKPRILTPFFILSKCSGCDGTGLEIRGMTGRKERGKSGTYIKVCTRREGRAGIMIVAVAKDARLLYVACGGL